MNNTTPLSDEEQEFVNLKCRAYGVERIRIAAGETHLARKWIEKFGAPRVEEFYKIASAKPVPEEEAVKYVSGIISNLVYANQPSKIHEAKPAPTIEIPSVHDARQAITEFLGGMSVATWDPDVPRAMFSSQDWGVQIPLSVHPPIFYERPDGRDGLEKEVDDDTFRRMLGPRKLLTRIAAFGPEFTAMLFQLWIYTAHQRPEPDRMAIRASIEKLFQRVFTPEEIRRLNECTRKILN